MNGILLVELLLQRHDHACDVSIREVHLPYCGEVHRFMTCVSSSHIFQQLVLLLPCSTPIVVGIVNGAAEEPSMIVPPSQELLVSINIAD